jgi:hypothetical protein
MFKKKNNGIDKNKKAKIFPKEISKKMEVKVKLNLEKS